MMFILLVTEKLETPNSKKEKASNNPGGTADILQRIKTLGPTVICLAKQQAEQLGLGVIWKQKGTVSFCKIQNEDRKTSGVKGNCWSYL